MNSKNGYEKKTLKSNGKPNRPWRPSTRDLTLYYEYIQGSLTQKQVGKLFNLAQSRASVIIKRINEWLWLETMDNIRVVKVQQVQSLQYVCREAMRAWEKSKKIQSSLITRISKGSFEKTRSLKLTAGESKYLEVAMKALNDIRDITGANAPIEVKHSGELRVAGMSLVEAYDAKINQMVESKKLLVLEKEN